MNIALLKKLARDERGLSTMEYAVLFVIIVVGALTLWSNLGESLKGKLTSGTGQFDSTLNQSLNGSQGNNPPGGG